MQSMLFLLINYVYITLMKNWYGVNANYTGKTGTCQIIFFIDGVPLLYSSVGGDSTLHDSIFQVFQTLLLILYYFGHFCTCILQYVFLMLILQYGGQTQHSLFCSSYGGQGWRQRWSSVHIHSKILEKDPMEVNCPSTVPSLPGELSSVSIIFYIHGSHGGW